MRHVLIADDEARIREVVRYALEKEGYRVSEAIDGRTAVDVAKRERVDLVVLDVMMPGLDGLEVCRRLKAETRAAVLFLSARSEELDRVLGLELGGDDYLTKPFSPRELVARVKAVLRRGEDTRDVVRVLSHGPVRIDPERHEVRCHDELVKLTATELGVLRALYERPGVVLSRAQLMERAYAYDNLVTERTLDTHVRRIRAKFRPCNFDPILTVHGVGYRAPEL